ncbi:nitrilase-related carbon-nitrogen hydrolase [Curtobacterium sp. MCJR17_043]|nr:nitrilase-related carbon-nitrogen hydrolase [Curtobacterium sp. MCJR17_043]WIB36991.1 nitrilase-related carbon-nitrogen hydrolase [Curtobacterium sp. MCJR17_043]
MGADGSVLETYRKVHLYDAFGSRESDRIEAGDPAQLPVVEVDGVRVGLETCYDLRFPEVTRRLAATDTGAADVVVLPAEWVRGPGKEHHWRTLLTARAVENTVWVLGVGQAPPGRDRGVGGARPDGHRGRSARRGAGAPRGDGGHRGHGPCAGGEPVAVPRSLRGGPAGLSEPGQP